MYCKCVSLGHSLRLIQKKCMYGFDLSSFCFFNLVSHPPLPLVHPAKVAPFLLVFYVFSISRKKNYHVFCYPLFNREVFTL